ncbi:ankyrin repeat-containing domain protein [Paraphoma chrysanthemicola]|nr:ankyrin repeat-containing domain protein [Paraphoma chrysanthemicola]
MAEAVGLAASIAQLINAATNVVKYVNTLQKFSRDSIEFAQEASLILSLMLRLQLRLQDARAPNSGNPVAKQTRMILGDVVPQMERELITLSSLLLPGNVSKTHALRRQLAWPITVSSVRDAFNRIERLKSAVGMLLDDNLSELVLEVQKDITHLRSLPAAMGNLSSKLDTQSQELKDDNKNLKLGINHMDTMVNSIHDQGELVARQQRQDRIVDFIAPFDFSIRYSTLAMQTLEGTGQWFLQSTEFKRWAHMNGSILWCPGMPGAGKSTLAATVVSHLQRTEMADETTAVLFAFCDYRQSGDQACVNLLSSLWRQFMHLRLLELQECNDLENKYQGPQRRIRPSNDEMLDMVQKEICRYRKVFIIIDALDELQSKHRSEFSESLCSLQRTNSEANDGDVLCPMNNHIKLKPCGGLSLMNLLITSRFTSRQTDHFGQICHLEIKASDDDLKKYITSQMRGAHARRIFKHINKDHKLLQEITEVITRKAEGMFLLAKLNVESLLDKYTVKAIRSALVGLPEGKDAISKAYDEALRRIEDQNADDRALALRVLSWVLRSYQPMRLVDLQYALTTDEDEYFDDNDLLPEVLIISVCAGLVVCEARTSFVRFVHYTTQEYLEGIRHKRFSDADFDIATTSVRYLLKRNHMMDPYCNKIDEFDTLTKRIPFYVYAAKYWGDHVRRCQDAEEENLGVIILDAPHPQAWQDLFILLDELLACERQACSALRTLLAATIKESGGAVGFALGQHPRSLQHINVCAYFGLTKAIAHYLQEDNDALNNSTDKFLGHTLHWAVLGGHEATMRMLLQRPECKQYINMMCFCKEVDDLTPFKVRSHHSPLHLAAYLERPIAVQMLLDSGADPALQNKWNYTSIHVAAHTGSIKSLTTILSTESGKQALMLKDKLERNALFEAADHGSTKALEVLIHLIEPLLTTSMLQDSLGDHTGRNPLHYSAERGFPDSVRVLLASGLGRVLALARDDTDSTPLHQVLFWGYLECVKAFLEWEHADIFFADPADTLYSLHLAAYHGHATIFGMIFESSCASKDMLISTYERAYNLDAKYPTGPTVWHSASRGGNVGVVKECSKWLGDDLKVDLEDQHGQTAFMDAAQRGHVNIMQYLFEIGADPNRKNNQGDTSLHLAIKGDLDTVVSLLLSMGVDTSTLNPEGETSLMFAAKKRSIRTVILLIKAGADPASIPANSIESSWLQAQSCYLDSARLSAATWLPRSDTDQFHAAFYVKTAFKKRLPPSLIGYIFDLAECWLTTRHQVRRRVTTNERTGHISYIATSPVSGYPHWPVRSLAFSATSYQEIVPHCPWPTNNDRAYTWWDAGKITPVPEGLKEPIGPTRQNASGPICFRNTHRGPHIPEKKSCLWPRHGHRLEWSAFSRMATADPSEEVVYSWAEESSEAACVQWLRGLRTGEKIVFKPVACFGDKLHHVFSAEATVCQSYLKR